MMYDQVPDTNYFNNAHIHLLVYTRVPRHAYSYESNYCRDKNIPNTHIPGTYSYDIRTGITVTTSSTGSVQAVRNEFVEDGE